MVEVFVGIEFEAFCMCRVLFTKGPLPHKGEAYWTRLDGQYDPVGTVQYIAWADLTPVMLVDSEELGGGNAESMLDALKAAGWQWSLSVEDFFDSVRNGRAQH